MEWHINDLSIGGQFSNCDDFIKSFEPLLKLRLQNQILSDRLFCSRSFMLRPATKNENIHKAVASTGNRIFKSQVIAWLAKAGPFWDDERQFIEEDYFEYQGIDVTNQGLGEVSRRSIADIDAETFSFLGSSFDFEKSPIEIQQGLSEDIIQYVSIINKWTIEQLQKGLEAIININTWPDLQEEIIRRFPQLVFSDNVMIRLFATPFSRALKNRIITLLEILNKVADETGGNGKLSEEGMRLLKNYFSGTCDTRQPLFKPESNKNKKNFESELTFNDPDNPEKAIFCHWHGKIQTPQTRIHFEWPRPDGQKKIKIVYIGPKICVE